MSQALTEENRQLLRHVSTATITTALFKRGFRNLFLQGVQRIGPGANMVGEAYTMRYIPAREDLDVLEVFKDLELHSRPALPRRPTASA